MTLTFVTKPLEKSCIGLCLPLPHTSVHLKKKERKITDNHPFPFPQIDNIEYQLTEYLARVQQLRLSCKELTALFLQTE